MPVASKKPDTKWTGRQAGLFGRVRRVRPSEVRAELKKALREALDQYENGADGLAYDLTELMRKEGLKFPGNSREIKSSTIWAWTSLEKPHLPTFDQLIGICLITGSERPIEVLASALGLVVLDEDEAVCYDLGRAIVDEEEAKRAMKEAQGQKREAFERLGL